MYTDINGPPIAEYEQIIEPVAAAAKSMGLDRRDSEPGFKDNKKKRPKPGAMERDERIAEPFLGLLIDFNA